MDQQTKSLEAVGIERSSFSIPEFCARNDISAATYFKLKRNGLGPEEMRLGSLIRITREAELAWQRARTNPTGKEAEARARAEAVAKARAKRAGAESVKSDNHVTKQKRKVAS